MVAPRDHTESDESRETARTRRSDGGSESTADDHSDVDGSPGVRRDGRGTKTEPDVDLESEAGANADTDADADTEMQPTGSADPTEEELRRQVEATYDFENFGPRDMAEMTREEWEVAFDADTWITGDELLSRVEDELKNRIAARDVFAVLERAEVDGEQVLVAYSDSDYAIVYPDGGVEGRGTVVRDVKPSVALCSMDDYEIETPPEHWQLPAPEEVPESGSELGNWMLQLLAGTQLLVGLAALVIWPIIGARDNIVMLAAGIGFVFIGLVLFATVANARLSEKFRVEEYRERLRTIGTASDERPAFLPVDDEAFETDERSRQVDQN